MTESYKTCAVENCNAPLIARGVCTKHYRRLVKHGTTEGGHDARPIAIEGDIARIPLTKGFEAVIDVADVHLVEGKNWFAMVSPRATYAGRGQWDASKGRPLPIRLHRLLMDAPDGVEVDHIDGDGLNNRRCNLRLASKSQNMRNQRLSASNTSGFKGVTWNRSRGAWVAQIGHKGVRHGLGYFDTAEDAHAAYCAASERIHGEFGRTS